jgi:cytochrome bd-type quinol oxidase subunit 1
MAVSLVSAVVIAGALGLVEGLVREIQRTARTSNRAIVLGISAGLFLTGVRTLGAAMAPSMGPSWPDFASADATIPLLAVPLGTFAAFLSQALFISLIVYAAGRLKQITGVCLLIVTGLILAAPRFIETIPSWLFAGVLVGAALVTAYELVLRHEPRAIVPMVAAMSVLSIMREGLHRAFPAALAGAIVACIAIAVATWMAARRTG